MGDPLNDDTCKVVAIIAAAGSGKRIGGNSPKQYLKITNKPILVHTLEKFDQCTQIDQIILVVQKEKVIFAEDLIKQWGVQKVTSVIEGGEERQDSIRQALHVIPNGVELIVIHDGVRPFVSIQKLDEAIQAGQKFGAAILAIPEKNTVKTIKDGWIDPVAGNALGSSDTPGF
jgi:2-C-methyl-D-erythritol 4-phosphate cytidylyltransferase